MSADLQELEKRLGHTFADRGLLVRALTHRSFSSEQRQSTPALNNEQFEFFGDAILGFLVSECLVLRRPGHLEGKLSKLKHRLVSADRLYQVAQALEIGRFLQLGRGEELGGGRLKQSLLADALEAIMAALYFDGGMGIVRTFVSNHVVGLELDDVALDVETLNYRGELEERAQMAHLPKPQYHTVEEIGPGHAKTFEVEVRCGDLYSGRGLGPTKKSASQKAARVVLDQFDLAKIGA
ncbi:MAG: ribonuclease III [Bryobacteraceae bacterium]